MLQADPAFPGAHRELGKVYISLRKNEDAEKQLKQAVEADPQDASAFYFLGAPLVQLQRYREGLPYLEKAQTMTPDSWATYFYMGKAQFQQHDTAAAVRLLRQAVDMNPQDPGSFQPTGPGLTFRGSCARGGRGHAARGATAYLLVGRRETRPQGCRSRRRPLSPLT